MPCFGKFTRLSVPQYPRCYEEEEGRRYRVSVGMRQRSRRTIIGLPGEDEKTKPISISGGATSRLLRSDTLVLKAMRRETPTPLQFIPPLLELCDDSCRLGYHLC